ATPAGEGDPLAAAALGRDYALEWGWPPVPGADGYAVYQSRGELGGPYEAQCRQAAGASGRQAYSQYVQAAPGEGFYGALTVLTGGATRESALSNADGAVFLPPQDALAPAQGAGVPNGRPQLSWARTEGAAGYLYFVLDRDPWDPRARVLWTNPANPDGTVSVTPELSATYPDGRAPLPSGTYSWWVAGVSFDEKGVVDGLSFSDPRSFTVP
ncbi:hypothetical protein, partial [Calidithermus chliarophilus]|uniref:hypothetical protein n=1 Tax=Calidithermus chliarophilus TaxID=52023 RepID=UPI000562F44B